MATDDTFTAEVPKDVEEHENFKSWNVDGSQVSRIYAAIETIKNEGLISSAKDLKDGLYEKKWKSGLRLYFAVVEKESGRITLILVGSGKGKEQSKAISESKKALEKYKVVKEDIKYNPNKK